MPSSKHDTLIITKSQDVERAAEAIVKQLNSCRQLDRGQILNIIAEHLSDQKSWGGVLLAQRVCSKSVDYEKAFPHEYAAQKTNKIQSLSDHKKHVLTHYGVGLEVQEIEDLFLIYRAMYEDAPNATTLEISNAKWRLVRNIIHERPALLPDEFKTNISRRLAHAAANTTDTNFFDLILEIYAVRFDSKKEAQQILLELYQRLGWKSHVGT